MKMNAIPKPEVTFCYYISIFTAIFPVCLLVFISYFKHYET